MHMLTSGLIRQGRSFLTANNTNDFWEMQYKQRAVHIRVLWTSLIVDQDSMKVVS